MSLNFDTVALNLVRAHEQLSNICTMGPRFTTCFCLFPLEHWNITKHHTGLGVRVPGCVR